MELILENLKRVAVNRTRLEKKLDIKIELIGNTAILLGDEEKIYTASKVIEAIDSNFQFEIAYLLLDPEFMIEHLNIKDYTRRKDLSEIKARIIGTQAKTIRLINELSGCYLTLHENTLSVIGHVNDMKEATLAITSLIRGSKQSSVYTYLERQKRIQHPDDLGLKKDRPEKRR